MVFPKDAVLWEAKVDGEAVNARSRWRRNAGAAAVAARSEPGGGGFAALRRAPRKPSRPVLTAPRLDAPVVIGEWTITGDEGRQFVPRGGTADLVSRCSRRAAGSGSEETPGSDPAVARGLAALLLGAGIRRGAGRPWNLVLVRRAVCRSLAVGSGTAAATTGRNASGSAGIRRTGGGGGCGEVTVEIGNLPAWMARTGVGLAGFVLGGVLVAVRGLFKGDRWWIGCGLVLLAASLLSIRGGAPCSSWRLARRMRFWLLPRISAILMRTCAAESGGGGMCSNCICHADARAAEAPALNSAGGVDDPRVADPRGRLFGTVDVTLRGEAGDRFLLREPAVLSSFEGAGLRWSRCRSRSQTPIG
jgi:hypothetical protein